MPRPRIWLRLPLIVFILVLGACGEEGESPEAQVRRFLAAGEEAVEGRSITQVQGFISEAYSDSAKRTRRDLLRLIGGYFLRNKSIHLFSKIDRLEIPAEGRAEVVFYVAMAGTPIEGIEQLPGLRADLHRFEFELGRGEDEEWQLLGAEWRRATLEDFSSKRD